MHRGCCLASRTESARTRLSRGGTIESIANGARLTSFGARARARFGSQFGRIARPLCAHAFDWIIQLCTEPTRNPTIQSVVILTLIRLDARKLAGGRVRNTNLAIQRNKNRLECTGDYIDCVVPVRPKPPHRRLPFRRRS